MTEKRSFWMSWLQLIRPPNLPTIPGDPLVGLLLSAPGVIVLWPQLVGPIIVALLLYAGGLVLNDWVDVEDDLRERPTRPIPKGVVNRGIALCLAVFLLAAGVAFACAVSMRCVVVSLALSAAVVFYNLVAKRIPVVGPVVMGACRALSVLLGWAASGVAFPPPAVWAAALVIGLYIFSVTCIARNETRGGPVGICRWLVPLIVVAAVGVVSRAGISDVGLVVGAVVVLHALLYAVSLGQALSPDRIAASVGGLIRGLILLQLLFCVDSRPYGPLCAVALLVLHVVSSLLGRRFYGS